MSRLLFYLQYAARNLWRNRRWSNFAMFSVAAGVATVVALRSLGLAISDSLTNNVRASLHGDISLSTGEGGFSFGNPNEEDGFSLQQINAIQSWVDEYNGQMSAYTEGSSIQITALDFNTVGRPQFISSYFVDPTSYPPTNDIRAIDPAGVHLGELFQGGNEVVISENLAQTQGIAVGDSVRVSGTTELFIVRGIVPTSAEAGLRNIFAAFFGFAYFDNALKAMLPTLDQPNNVGILLPDGLSAEQIEDAANDLSNQIRSGNFFYVQTVPEIIEENQQIADLLGSFIVVLGLGALLIGGVGIMNTMLVMVRRRTEEIASLKTFGLKGRQVAALFMSEALLLGAGGSILGSLIGILLSSLANTYGQMLIQQPLTWKVYPEALLFGFVLGMVVTAVFGVAPVLTAVKIRPAIILRPNETYIPRTGCLQSVGVVLLVVLAIGTVAGQIISPTFALAGGRAPNPFLVGIIGVAITLAILGILVGLLWVVVWLIGRLPVFGSVDLRLALRNLSTHRIRTATTLLALSAGMFALSSIAFFGAGVREIIQFSLSETFGGNVLIFPVLAPSNAAIDAKLNELPGVTYRTRIQNYDGQFEQIDEYDLDRPSSLPNVSAVVDGETLNTRQMLQRWDLRNPNTTLRQTDNPNLPAGTFIAGRNLTLEDAGKRVTVLRMNPLLNALGLHVGSIVAVRIEGRLFDFEVVGITQEAATLNPRENFVIGGMLVPPGSLEGIEPSQFQMTIAQVEPQQLNNVLVELSSLPLVFSIDISFIDSFLSRLIEQMSAIPILVGLLSLGAAAVIMANTVALATLERRRQIGILKAVGLKGGRVLRVMLLENTIISLIGSLLGIGLSALGVALMAQLSANLALAVPTEALPVAILLLVVAILIAWAATVLSARTVIGERVTNVLRYE
jgi:putative ABC transport system permease protein